MEEIDTSEMTMGEILELRKKMGSKQFAKSVTHPKVAKLKGKEVRQTKEKETGSKRSYQLEKNAPEEVSSKKKPPKFRQVVEGKSTDKVPNRSPFKSRIQRKSLIQDSTPRSASSATRLLTNGSTSSRT